MVTALARRRAWRAVVGRLGLVRRGSTTGCVRAVGPFPLLSRYNGRSLQLGLRRFTLPFRSVTQRRLARVLMYLLPAVPLGAYRER
jgi:hypothetical protein